MALVGMKVYRTPVTGREKLRTLLAEPGALFSFSAQILASVVGARWLHLFDRITDPPNGTVPDYPPIPIPSDTLVPLGADSAEEPFFIGTAGVAVGVSTTEDTYTAPAADEARFYAIFVPNKVI